MIKKYAWLLGALVIAALGVGVYGTTTAFADDGVPPLPFGGRGPGGPHGGHMLDAAALEAVADALNMSTDDLSAALESGKTLEELADGAGVDGQAIRDALSAVREASLREHIAQALEDGTITQEHADWLLEGLDKGFLDGPGFGFGHGPGGDFDRGAPPATPPPGE